MKIFISASLLVAALSATKTDAAFPAEVVSLMDTTADPCDNFFQYTCGNWVKNFTLTPDVQAFSYSFDGISERNAPIIQDIIKQDWPLIGEYYDACMNMDALTAMGSKPVEKDLARINAAATKKDLARVAGELATFGPALFTGLGFFTDLRNSSMNALFLVPANVLLQDSEYYTDAEKFAAIEAPYRKYISRIITLAGINVNGNGQQTQQRGSAAVDTKKAEDIFINIEKKYMAISATPDELGGDYKSKYSELAAKYPLTFQAMAQGAGLLDSSSVTADSTVLLDSASTYFDRIEKLFNSLDLNDLKLYYSILYVSAFASYLGEPFAQANFDLFKTALRNVDVRPPRSKVCTGDLILNFQDLLGKYFFLKMFDSDREQNVQLMVNSIEKAMGEHIAALSWLDDATRKEASTKLAKIANLIGHSTVKKSYPYVLSRDNYFANFQTLRKQSYKESLERLFKPVNRQEWGISAATVNAYYSPPDNKMVFPAAILQPPFYRGNAHPVQNFGAIGAIIGHEVTHGFDTSGRNYDGDGNLRDWWTSSTAKEFEARANCMRNQYSEMVVYGDSGKPVGNVNGNQTIGENIADNGGVSLSYDAYHDWVKSGAKFDAKGVEESEVDKLFFVSFGQIWCGKISDKAQKQDLLDNVHSPLPVRVNGVAMNSEQFSKTFQCPVGSKMNPEKKCKLW
jgi:endothelin-converting enzyme